MARHQIERNRLIAKHDKAGTPIPEMAQEFGLTVGGMKAVLARLAQAGLIEWERSWKKSARRNGKRPSRQGGRPHPGKTPAAAPEEAVEERERRITTSIRIRPEVWRQLQHYCAEALLAGIPRKQVQYSKILEQAIKEYLAHHPIRPKGKAPEP